MDNSRTGNPAATIHSNPGKIDAMQIQPYLFYNGRCEEAIELLSRRGRGRSDDAHAFQGQP